MRGIYLFWIAVILAAAAALPAAALDPIQWKPGEDTTLTLSIMERVRWEWRDNADFDSENDDRNDFIGNRFRLDLKLDITEAFTLRIQGQDTRHWGSRLKGTRFDNYNTDLRLAYFEARGIARIDGLSMTVGRQELSYGDERLVGAFGWSNVGRSFDAFKFRYQGNQFFVDTFIAGARQRPFVPDKKTQTLTGLYFGGTHEATGFHAEVYFFLKNDSAWFTGEVPGQMGHTRIQTYGTRLVYKPVEGLEAVGEFAFQQGNKGPDSHRADAQALRVKYTFDSRFKPMIGMEAGRSTGDKDPDDGKSGSFDNLFPTNHNKYGYIDYHNWSNTRYATVFGAMSPSQWVTLRLGFWSFKLDSAKAPWTSAGGGIMGWDPTGMSGRSVGKEIDFTAGGKIKKLHMKWLAGDSWYDPGNFAEAVRGSDRSRYGFIQIGFDF